MLIRMMPFFSWHAELKTETSPSSRIKAQRNHQCTIFRSPWRLQLSQTGWTFLTPPCLSDFLVDPGWSACALEVGLSDLPAEVQASQAATRVAAPSLEVDFPVPWEGAWATFLVEAMLPVPALLEVKGASSPGMRR